MSRRVSRTSPFPPEKQERLGHLRGSTSEVIARQDGTGLIHTEARYRDVSFGIGQCRDELDPEQKEGL